MENEFALLNFPNKPKELDNGRFLTKRHRTCLHEYFDIDIEAGKCFCRQCKEEVASMYILQKLCFEETRWHSAREAVYKAELALEKRCRTKCQHCGEMSRINHN